jgi:histidinol-phosphate aminotransferase
MSDLIRKSVQALHGYVPGEQPREKGVTKLNTNENPYPPSPMVAEALRDAVAENLRLYPDPVAVKLREAIAGLHDCALDNVFAGNGSDEILALCTRAFVEDDGRIGFFVPSYSLYPVLAEIRCVAAQPLELTDDFRWAMPDDYRCSLFFLANPNAPTGILYDKPTVRRFCERFQGVVVIDEAYVDFAKADCADIALELGNVLVVRTFSKAYSLAGIRVGYALGSPDLVGALFKLKDSYNTNALSQRVATAALADVEHMRHNVAKIKTSRQRLAHLLEARGFSVYPSDANFLWVRPPPQATAEDLYARLRNEGVLVRYFPGHRTAECLRITVGTDGEIDVLIAALDRHIARHAAGH